MAPTDGLAQPVVYNFPVKFVLPIFIIDFIEETFLLT